MEAVDSYIPLPERPIDKPFMMPIEDVFSIEGRGTVVTGRIDRGIVKVNDPVEIVGIRPTGKTVVTGVEMFHKLLDHGEAGMNVGCLVRGIKREDVERGQVLAKPGSINPHTKFKAQVFVLSKEEGGRHTPFFTGYRPQFYIRTTDVTGSISLPEGTEMVMPGDNVEMGVELITPIAVEDGMRFAIREGGHTVGAGAVTSDREVAEQEKAAASPWRRKSASGSRPTTTGSWTRPASKIVETVVRTGAHVAGPVPCPPGSASGRWSARRSSTRTSREQFEMRTHKRILDILDPNPKVVDALMRLNLPSGVDIEIKLGDQR